MIRKVFRTLKDSCFTQLKWAIHRLGVDAHCITQVIGSQGQNVRVGRGIKEAFLHPVVFIPGIPTAVFCGLVSRSERKIWVFDELYQRALTNRMIAEKVTALGYAKERIFRLIVALSKASSRQFS